MTVSCIWKSYDYAGCSEEIFDLFSDEPFVFFLDSSLRGLLRGRFSFIGFDPFDIVSGKGHHCLAPLKMKFNRYSAAHPNVPTPLWGGVVGFLGYDAGLSLENIKRKAVDDLNLPDCFFGFYDTIITIDHLKNKLIVTSTGLPETRPYLVQERARERLDNIIRRLSSYKKTGHLPLSQDEKTEEISCASNFRKEQYLDAIRQALGYIRRGDIYQVNLSQRFLFDAGVWGFRPDPIELYRFIRRISPSCFGGYFDAGDVRIISSSPERFLYKQGRLIQTRPMKGTRPRGNTFWEDETLRKELLESPKEKAELLMVTDLERNDLGRVCEYGTVKVRHMRSLEKYKTVFQTTSTVEGLLAEGADCFDVITACFPSGSVTGCPKIRAMEIIDELEGVRRSIYTGSLGYISFSGEMDFNILIRTLMMIQEKIYFHVGGGIVADSDAQREYEETLVKARAMYQSLQNLCYAHAGGVG